MVRDPREALVSGSLRSAPKPLGQEAQPLPLADPASSTVKGWHPTNKVVKEDKRSSICDYRQPPGLQINEATFLDIIPLKKQLHFYLKESSLTITMFLRTNPNKIERCGKILKLYGMNED